MYTSGLLTHSWDLAAATGQSPEWPADAVLTGVLGAMKQGLPADRPAEFPFDPAVAVPDDTPLIDQLAAWTGRSPAEWDRV